MLHLVLETPSLPSNDLKSIPYNIPKPTLNETQSYVIPTFKAPLRGPRDFTEEWKNATTTAPASDEPSPRQPAWSDGRCRGRWSLYTLYFLTQSLQKSLIKEDGLNHTGIVIGA